MRLSDHDASFLYGETASAPMHGIGLVVLEGTLEFEEYRQQISSRLHLAPRLRERLVFVPMNVAHPKWVPDPDFDVDNHVVCHKVPVGTNLEDAMDIAIELAEPLLDRSRPLWKTYFLEGIPGHTVLVQITHHAMVDGASAVDINTAMMDLEPDAPAPLPPSEPWNPPPLQSAPELWQEAMAERMRTAGERLAARPTPDQQRLLQRANEVMQRFVTDPVITAPWNAAAVGPKRCHEWIECGFEEIRTIRQALGGTFNDIMLAVVSEAAARYLERHREAVDGQYMRLMCPVNVRGEGESGVIGNRVSAMYPTLPAWSMDMGARLAAVCEETQKLKTNRDAEAIDTQMRSGQGAVPPAAMSQTLLVGTPWDPTALLAQNPPPVVRDARNRPPLLGFNFTCTNVPGLQVPQYICGRQVIRNLGTMMLGGTLGYAVCLGSYNQRMYVNLISDPRLLPDLELMREYIDTCLDELKALAAERAQ